ncbi:hypothetical protein EDB84DRAFT_1681522 [Lactarius hengduanensis]|nr:hypothetical protein EDB84DRAFT_1681522 [Lactarius hengduanensis]
MRHAPGNADTIVPSRMDVFPGPLEFEDRVVVERRAGDRFDPVLDRWFTRFTFPASPGIRNVPKEFADILPSQPHACACIADEAAQSHSLETVRAPPAHADLRACAQEPRTDFETLRASFVGSSMIARADAVQLAQWPILLLKSQIVRFSSGRALRLTSGRPELKKNLGVSHLPDLNARSTEKERRRSVGLDAQPGGRRVVRGDPGRQAVRSSQTEEERSAHSVRVQTSL